MGLSDAGGEDLAGVCVVVVVVVGMVAVDEVTSKAEDVPVVIFSFTFRTD